MTGNYIDDVLEALRHLINDKKFPYYLSTI